MANRELRQGGDKPDDAIVIITAPTGTAAYNVSGSTLHSAFMMSAKSIDALSAEKLAMLHNKYYKLVLVINISLMRLAWLWCQSTETCSRTLRSYPWFTISSAIHRNQHSCGG